MRKACGYVWRRVLKQDGSAVLLAFEVSPSGAVHAHALYYGPLQDVRVVRALYLDRIPEVAKYVVAEEGWPLARQPRRIPRTPSSPPRSTSRCAVLA